MRKKISIFRSIRLMFKPLKMVDSDFGLLRFMFISNHPERSYWECEEWKFPPTGTHISIFLQGDESGPFPEYRQWNLGLVNRYSLIIERVKPKLTEVYKHWFNRDLPSDIFKEMKLSGFDVEDPRTIPVKWDISFETTGDKWLGIIIPFIGDEPKDAVVDT